MGASAALADRPPRAGDGWGEWRLEPGSGRTTRFIWDEQMHLPWGGLGETALRAYGPYQREMLRRSLRNLAALAEKA